jgi:hypothetical protein
MQTLHVLCSFNLAFSSSRLTSPFSAVTGDATGAGIATGAFGDGGTSADAPEEAGMVGT